MMRHQNLFRIGLVLIVTLLLMEACTAPGGKFPIPTIFGTPRPTQTPTATPSSTPSPTPTPQPSQVVGTGERQLNNGDWDGARQDFQLIVDAPNVEPEARGSAQLGLAEVALRRGDFAGAKNSLDTFISQYANHRRIAQAYFLRGDAKMGLSDWQGAIADFNAYLVMRPGLIDSYVYERMGDANLALGQNDPALQDYEQSTAGGRDPIALLQLRERVALRERTLANSLMNADQADAAAKTFSDAFGQYQAILAVAQFPAYRATIEYAVAQTLYESGQKDKAYDEYNHVFETYPNSPEALESLRILLDTDRDINQYQRGIVNFNHKLSRRYTAGTIYPRIVCICSQILSRAG
jgi:outer membrane protein assembly factor BamD (BamD/ComL family)